MLTRFAGTVYRLLVASDRARHSAPMRGHSALAALAAVMALLGLSGPLRAAHAPLGPFLARYEPCIANASHRYRLPRGLVLAVLMTENGRPGLARRNHNGTVDYGPMQINTARLAQLRRYGLTARVLRDDACTNIWAGAALLQREIYAAGDFWTGVAHYHSHTPALGRAYAARVRRNWLRLLHRFRSGQGYEGLR